MRLFKLFQIRLRTLLAIMLVGTLGVAWYGERWRNEVRHTSAAEYLTGRGATVRRIPSLRGTMSDVSFHETAMRSSVSTSTGAGPSSPSSPKLSLEDFEQLRLLPTVATLSIEGDILAAETLGEIATLNGLVRLEFSHCPLDDAGLQELAALKNLRELNLEATQVTDAGVEALRRQLPDLEVNDD